METWFIGVISLCIAALLKSLLNLLSPPPSNKNLPPGPPAFPVIGNLFWLRRSFSEIEPLLRKLRVDYGPIITLRIGSRASIFIGSHSAAHRALIQNGVVFSDRPTGLATSRIANRSLLNINSSPYGHTWRLLRRNLTAEILHPSRVKSYSHARQWVFQILIDRLLQSDTASAEGVKVMDHFQYAMFCLLVLMCFGDKLDEVQIKQIETSQREMLLRGRRFNILNIFPRIGKILFRNRWKELIKLRQNQERVLFPIIKSRKEFIRKQQEFKLDEEERVVAYVDTLVDLELPEEKRKLNDGELLTLCSEFINAGTDTTSTALQWIMANLVKYPSVQSKLYEEIVGVVGSLLPLEKSESNEKKNALPVMIKEEDLQKMPYLKAVVLEGLRRHPPGHFVLPHAVREDVELEGYVVPKGATVNFMVADMGWDPKVWAEPMEFKPERFLSNDTGSDSSGNNCSDGGKREGEGTNLFDITGSREIKMMPFGAGRRICPGANLALLHLELFVANFVWYFEWKRVEGDEVDLSEKPEFTTVMKNPLRVNLCPRWRVR